ncbi:MAG: homoserine O-succinyltransferase, partial [Clostridia bacterium]|nr:homoserine O-succinyltransferase [Clostridia bacterium]
MPITVPASLPARAILENENIFVMDENRALHQDIRPLKILILNLMPTKQATEAQLLRCLSNTPLQIEPELLQTSTYTSKNTSQEHLLSFYKTFDEVRANRYDGMIITGAPVEQMEFEEVEYWQELCEIMEWSRQNVHSVFHICWGAQAGLYYHYGIPKYPLEKKVSGIYMHSLQQPKYPLVRGFDDRFFAPHSRHSEVRVYDILACKDLDVVALSDLAGIYIVTAQGGRQIFFTGHSEYDAETLALEYRRDLGKGLNPEIPYNYFPNDDPSQLPLNRWRSHANLLYSNWLNYYVYQSTPY